MDFDFSTDHYQMRDSVRRYLGEQWGPRRARSAGGEFAPALWSGLCDLGVQTLLVPEQHGGAGLGLVDLALVLEEFGRALVPGLMADTLLASEVIARFGSESQQASLLPQVASGACRIAFAHVEADGGPDTADVALEARAEPGGWRLRGHKLLVPCAQAATHLIVSARPQGGQAGLFLLATGSAGLAIRSHRGVDPHGLLCRVDFDGAAARSLGAQPDARALARLLESSTWSAAAQMVGIAAAALDIAVAYAKERVQFDRPIGSFQAIKHKCADMLVALETARTAAYYAAWAAAQDEAAAPLAVSMAKAVGGDACRLACNEALQIHGGVGFTWEFDIHLYLKRGKLLEHAWGDANFHRERVAAAMLERHRSAGAAALAGAA